MKGVLVGVLGPGTGVAGVVDWCGSHGGEWREI
jgi:hypothetical protein